MLHDVSEIFYSVTACFYGLSGGQMQRTSIGRAIIKNPALLLCDEPTGALDYATSKEIIKLLEDINEEYKTTILII